MNQNLEIEFTSMPKDVKLPHPACLCPRPESLDAEKHVRSHQLSDSRTSVSRHADDNNHHDWSFDHDIRKKGRQDDHNSNTKTIVVVRLFSAIPVIFHKQELLPALSSETFTADVDNICHHGHLQSPHNTQLQHLPARIKGYRVAQHKETRPHQG